MFSLLFLVQTERIKCFWIIRFDCKSSRTDEVLMGRWIRTVMDPSWLCLKTVHGHAPWPCDIILAVRGLRFSFCPVWCTRERLREYPGYCPWHHPTQSPALQRLTVLIISWDTVSFIRTEKYKMSNPLSIGTGQYLFLLYSYLYIYMFPYVHHYASAVPWEWIQELEVESVTARSVVL